MSLFCPYCQTEASDPKNFIRRVGSYYRKSDSKEIQRYRCHACQRGFSQATTHPCFKQQKRTKNEILRRLLCSGISQRRAAEVLCLNRKTVVRKFLFLAKQAKLEVHIKIPRLPKVVEIQFDDMETFEHTKMKPLSITLAVEKTTQRVLGAQVSQMPAKGLLAAKSRAKYGFREDLRRWGRHKLFERIQMQAEEVALIRSDSNPHYPKDVKLFFPKAVHETVLGKRGAVTGQGELKKVGHDPIFDLNHTCARLREDLNRLKRKTWCTTKKPDRLQAHLDLYINFHNQRMGF